MTQLSGGRCGAESVAVMATMTRRSMAGTCPKKTYLASRSVNEAEGVVVQEMIHRASCVSQSGQSVDASKGPGYKCGAMSMRRRRWQKQQRQQQ